MAEDLRYTEPYRPMRDRGRETSDALVAVRTVLSRAETALQEIDRPNYTRDEQGNPVFDSNGFRILSQDEDYDEMRAALEHVVESLEWWRRTGRPRRPS
ncbi:hypothetical protein HPO96_37080 [Kribbella sandramycini]|uniref:Uncharacterized protein n=1 Tax=Kribbella sandramycini TaxID=60450 RepID=A0A7Y4P530_9ACTN|nr:hypothetical protein [Kribbella sandramycini]MBB6564413.1 hypothetical protein [Kribbella sandramycini]NOL45874.1 hypothetical protein [Kribbella sandramycini]